MLKSHTCLRVRIPTSPTPYDARGRYIKFVDEMKKISIIREIIHNELDKFWENAQQRLNALESGLYDKATQHEIREVKKDLKAAVTTCFGNSVTASCLTVLCGPTRRNEYIKDNFKRKRDEIALQTSDDIEGLHLYVTTNIGQRYLRET